ncbi:sigma factor regulatory protein FecR [Pseudomonas sp. M47T1]|uniref:FecR domain-containing protein n=1 Tax=Pseudomonas sp. M47T1 TaxID=1179778 RepID=UPI0002608D8A|nr:sigma factor regulatory protein FecR [Pseudomonas sp. M47T1]
MSSAGSFAPQVAEQAVQWLLDMHDAPLAGEQQQRFEHWLASNSEHQRAWAHIHAVNQRLRGIDGPLAHAALDSPRLAGRRQALKALLVVAMGGAAIATLNQQPWLPPLTADLRSPVGERRHQQLSDGSQLQLNTGSAVDIRFDAHQRLVRLLEGELQIDASHEQRPLRIATAQGQITPLDGRINVRQLRHRTRVSVLSGTAQLQPAYLQGYPLRFETGQQVEFDAHHARVPRPIDANSSAWVNGMLMASHMRLADFLGELARYRRGELTCADEVADLLISGSYPLADTERILDLLEVALPVRVKRFTRFWVSVQARA